MVCLEGVPFLHLQYTKSRVGKFAGLVCYNVAKMQLVKDGAFFSYVTAHK